MAPSANVPIQPYHLSLASVNNMVPQKKTLARKPAVTSLPSAALQALINHYIQRGPIELHALLTKLKIRETEAF
jgi:hypothetical protein